ncbi:MAG: hypothetical protein NTV93_14450 [Verrucomicrobia bacterium]|nr:hypothetical protein [Verrucomicrobiota bacterium]
MASINTVARAGMRGAYSSLVRISNDISILKNLPAPTASLAAGILSAIPGLSDRAETVRAVGHGMASESASWGQRLSALAFQFGGWGLADAVRLVSGAIPWCLGFLVLFWGASRLKGRPRNLGTGLVWLLCAGVSAHAVWMMAAPASPPIRDLRLLAPLALVDMIKSEQGRVFMNPSARPGAAVCGGNIWDNSLTEKSASDLAGSPTKWREEDRSKPFSAVLIAGRVFEAKPLIRHLLDAPDWYLARIDNQGLLFLHGQKPDLAATPVPDFPAQRDRAIYLAQYSLNLDAAGFQTLAASSMDEALSLEGKDYEVLFRAASLSASQSLWERARKQSAAALKASPGAYEASYLQALSLLETRAFEKSFECTSILSRQYPDDFNVLLLHARAARAVHDYTAETKTLERLLRLAEDSKSPTARIHIFLAQSWAQRGFPEQAISHYQAALAEGLSSDEAKDVRAIVTTIENNRLKP